ncbi:GNAT family N-acetyltransferase [candidate division TA06 bacterium]|uniref:GNAT family N-acetyltransferase n=1 Tax=candidate division TA06 bacterium TaxID=2250710 RepID=A0A933IAM8_UNCT6|nr:GNAT family N-acetyltransferase [candidate division TA06 bacterium]
MTIRRYQKKDSGAWNQLVEDSWNGTFLHTRRYLSYHGNRFKDVSLIIENSQGLPVAAFPAAVDPHEPMAIISHPGITYGGIVHKGDLRGEDMVNALGMIAKYYSNVGYKSLSYKAVPFFYHRIPAEDDRYAISRLNGRLARCELSAVINLFSRGQLSGRRKRCLTKAAGSGLKIVSGKELLPDFWRLLEKTLRQRHNVSPVHSLSEITKLSKLFPENIECVAAVLGRKMVAGALLYKTHSVTRTQYLASDEEGRKNGALDLVLENSILKAKETGGRYLDLGTSNLEQGRVLNQNLYRFKTEFGAGGVVFEQFQIML